MTEGDISLSQSQRPGLPTADDVAIALIVAARVYGEDPESITRGEPSVARRAAMCALEIVFPVAPKAALVRMVGGPKGFLKNFEVHVPQTDRKRRYAAQWRAVTAIQAGTLHPQPAAIELRRPFVPQGENVTAELMGDPTR